MKLITTRIERGGVLEKDGYEDHYVYVGTHVGTHVDAPSHMVAGGITLDKIPLERFSGRGVYVKTRTNLTVDAVRELPIQEGDIVLFHTGMSNFYHQPDYYENYPAMTEELAHYLVEKKVKMVGVDMCSVDHELLFDKSRRRGIIAKALVKNENGGTTMTTGQSAQELIQRSKVYLEQATNLLQEALQLLSEPGGKPCIAPPVDPQDRPFFLLSWTYQDILDAGIPLPPWATMSFEETRKKTCEFEALFRKLKEQANKGQRPSIGNTEGYLGRAGIKTLPDLAWFLEYHEIMHWKVRDVGKGRLAFCKQILQEASMQ
jgi:kynurenine formamidase